MRSKGKGFLSQFVILFRRDVDIFLNDRVKLMITLLLPVMIGLVITAVTKRSEVSVIHETTKSTLFTVISAAIYTGMFNSLTLICKERSIIKREYMTGMKMSSYIYSNVALQAIICAVQTLLFMFIYWYFPSLGLNHELNLMMPSAFWDYTIGLFLVMMASDMMGMFISSLVRSNEIANLTAPVIIIVQLVMSGVLFELKGIMDMVASLTVSKWGMESLGRVAHLTELKCKVENDVPDPDVETPEGFLDLEELGVDGEELFEETKDTVIDEAVKKIAEDTIDKVRDVYDADKLALMKDWLILFAFIAVLSVLCIIALRRVSRDQR